MEVLIALVVATLVMKHAASDVAYAVRGKPSPRAQLALRLLDQHAANAEARGERPSRWRSGRHAGREYASALWHDSLAAARQRHDRRFAKRSAKRREQTLAIERGEVAPRWIDRQGGGRRWLRSVRGDLAARYDCAWDRMIERRERRAQPHASGLDLEVTPDPAETPELDPATEPAGSPFDASSGSEGAQGPAEAPDAAEDGPEPPHEPEQPDAGSPPVDEPDQHHEAPHTRPPLSLVPNQGHDTTTPNGDPPMTATINGEVVGLSGAIAFCDASAATATAGLTHVDQVTAALAAGEVGGAAAAQLSQAAELMSAAAAAFTAAGDALRSHTIVKDSYAAAPDAGTKEFVTAD